MGKGEIAHKEQFLLFPPRFLFKQTNVSAFLHISAIISLFAAELEEPRIALWGKGLNVSSANAMNWVQAKIAFW